MKKILGLALAFGLASSAMAAYTAPSVTRTGPVSAYGQLTAGVNSKNVGRIYGACSGTEVQVKGMSLYWSNGSGGVPYYSEDAVNAMVSDMNIEVIRIAMGTGDASWGISGYSADADLQKSYVERVVSAAIKNDIYVIIDWHSHNAHAQGEAPKNFFSEMAQTYGSYDNVIFEIYNEPAYSTSTPYSGCPQKDNCGTLTSWTAIKSYAESVITEIRKYSDNLIIVGTPQYDQLLGDAADSPLTATNVAYAFHFYAGTHTKETEGTRVVNAMNRGLSVFVSEWGTCNADGNGSVSYRNAEWQNFLNDNNLSWANWSAGHVDEGCSAFSTNYTSNGKVGELSVYVDNQTKDVYYTESGSAVKNYMNKAPSGGYAKCTNAAGSSSSGSSASAGGNSLIDDFEDGNGYAYTGLEDYWYAYTDKNDGGKSSFTNAKDEDGNAVVVIKGAAAGGSDYGVGLTSITLNQGTNENAPYVALGLDIAAGLAGCKTITYKYKGAAHNLKAVMAGDISEDGSTSPLTEWNRHMYVNKASTSWTTASIDVTKLAQDAKWGKQTALDIAEVVQLQWEVKGDKEGTQPSPNYLYIDDVNCVGMDITPVVAPEEDGSSSSAKSSASTGSTDPEDPVSGSSSSKAGSSASTTPTVSEANIDDFEDGDNVAKTGDEDYWYAFKDDAASIGNKNNGTAAEPDYAVVDAAYAANGSEYGAGLTGITTGGTSSYAALGLDVTKGSLAGCQTITYKYKGAGHNLKAVLYGDVETVQITNTAGKKETVSAVTYWNRHAAAVDGSTDWETAIVAVADLKQEKGWGKTAALVIANVIQLQWEVKGTPSANHLYIDDVSCIGASGSGEGAGSSASAGTLAGNVDDFEDGDAVASTGASDYWYAFTDVKDKGASSFSNVNNGTAAKPDYVVVDAAYAANGSEYGVGLSGIVMDQGDNEYDPYVALGLDIAGGLAGCTAITYDYKGAAHNLKAIMKSDIGPNGSTSPLTEWNRHKYAVKASEDWAVASVPVSSLKQESNWGKTASLNIANVVQLQWEVKGEAEPDYLYIDNVTCVGLKSSTGSSSSVISGSSSSRYPITSSNSNGGYNNGYNNGSNNGLGGLDALAVSMAQSGLNVGLRGNTLNITVAKAGLVKVQVFDMMGHVVERHANYMNAGSFAHDFKNMAKGSYVVRVQQGSYSKSVRLQVR